MNKKTLLVIGTILITGCLHEIRRYTYPPEFTYMDKTELSTSMQSMASLIAGLNKTLTLDDSIPAETKQTQVIEILKKLETTASKLNSSQLTQHPQLDHNLQSFRNNLEYARMAAQRTPPNYYLAGTITGSCNNCHLISK